LINRYFIPVSVGNHLFSANRLEFLINFVNNQKAEANILICDTLRIMSNSMMKSYQTPQKALILANKNIKDTLRMANKVIAKTLNKNIEISTIGDIEKDDLFWSIKGKLFDLLITDIEIYNYLENMASEKMKFLKISRTKRNILIEYGYIIEETSAALYVTEIKGFSTEIYISKLNGFIDYLQEQHESKIASFVGGEKIKRKFLSWDEIGIKI